MSVVRVHGSDIWQLLHSLSSVSKDALLYLLSAVFAGLTSVFALTTDYREWGTLAVVPYSTGALICLGVLLANRRATLSASLVRRVRSSLMVALTLATVIVPLCSELAWRASSTHGEHAQPEVAVIERAGDRIAVGSSPYPSHPTSYGVAPTNDAHAIDRTSFFPYLPGMAAFGLLNATSLPAELGDARVLFVIVGLISLVLALFLSRASPDRKLRAAQFFVLLPTGALPMVTGGDDIPVIGFVLLGLVLAVRRRPLACGLLFALACSLKFTAWPIAALTLVAVRAEGGRRSLYAFLTGVSLLVPVLAYGYLGDAHAFIQNVIQFPLGLTAVKSPAASPLLGQFLVSAFPRDRRALTLVLGVVGVLIVLVAYRLHRPRTIVKAIRFCAFALCVATALAPATRFGYLIYPTLLYVWAYVLADDTSLVRVEPLVLFRRRATLERASAGALRS